MHKALLDAIRDSLVEQPACTNHYYSEISAHPFTLRCNRCLHRVVVEHDVYEHIAMIERRKVARRKEEHGS